MISVKDLHFGYKKKKVFNGLTLTLQPGHIYGLLGKNGTGKSTLLRNISGLLFPDRGSITVNGEVPGKRRPSFLRDLFLIPEEFYLPDVTPQKLITYHAPFYPGFSGEQFNRYLAEFEIPSGNTIQHMSYGQKKKTLISFGLACNAPVLLMDEPTNGLDIMSKSQFRKVIAGALDEKKCIVISTHQVKDLESLIDRITIIDDGKILFDQTIEDISRKLSFKISFDNEDLNEALYSESGLKGNIVVGRNHTGEESRLDLEVLYKAIILNQDKIQSAFR
ncbi:MAG: ABC transporter ATP-binding protein [Chitinophagaceae bacterium]|nr:ABC transporter ATP-binding protein [Chitinophagaceae bacterium]MCW5929589.1 ABC transporter ATP-binding protein [Chitinophagaceae bacterium]